MISERLAPLLDTSHICDHFGFSLLCNAIFVPCDLTTGMPRPICTDSCYYYRTHCSKDYSSAIRFAAALEYPLKDNCENTFSHLQLGFNFHCSSNSLQNSCIDLQSM